MKIQQRICKCCKICKTLPNFIKFPKFQLDNLVDFEKCCKARIYLQRSAPIQPKTSEILPNFCQKLATTLRVGGGEGRLRGRGGGRHLGGYEHAAAAESRVAVKEKGRPNSKGDSKEFYATRTPGQPTCDVQSKILAFVA